MINNIKCFRKIKDKNKIVLKSAPKQRSTFAIFTKFLRSHKPPCSGRGRPPLHQPTSSAYRLTLASCNVPVVKISHIHPCRPSQATLFQPVQTSGHQIWCWKQNQNSVRLSCRDSIDDWRGIDAVDLRAKLSKAMYCERKIIKLMFNCLCPTVYMQFNCLNTLNTTFVIVLHNKS